MSIEKVREYFGGFGIAERILEFPVSSATVELAAIALGVEGARIAKSMSFKQADEPIIVVVAGDMKIDNGKYKAEFGQKPKMLTYDEACEMTGHAPGGVCPFGVKAGTPVYLDESLKRFKTVFPAAGESNNAVEMTISELERTSELTAWVDVTKPIAEG